MNVNDAAILVAIGSIPWAYLIVRFVTGEDITAHGTGNVGAMNVRRSTGSWGWFVVAMVMDASKGILPAFVAKWLVGGGNLTPLRPWGMVLESISSIWWHHPLLFMPMLAVAGAVLGHNYSAWMALAKRGLHRTGKGLATGGGALIAYDWRYFVAAVAVGLHDGRTGRRRDHAAAHGVGAALPGLAVRTPHGRPRLRGAPQTIHRPAEGQ